VFTHHPAIRTGEGKEGREREVEKWLWGWWGRTCPSERVREEGGKGRREADRLWLCALWHL